MTKTTRSGGGRRWEWSLLAGLLVAWRHFSVRVSTDDAQIDGHVNAVSARVGGTVTAVLVADNQFVEKGTPLVRIDATRLRDRRGAGGGRPRRERGPGARRAHGRADDQHDVHLAGDRGRRATSRAPRRASSRRARACARRRPRPRKAAQDLERLKPLLAKDEVSQQEYDAAVSDADAAHAARESAEASVREAEKAVEAAQGAPRPGADRARSRSRSRRRAPTRRRPRRRWRGRTSPRRGSTSSTPRSRPPSAASSAGARVEVGQVVQAGPAAPGRGAARGRLGGRELQGEPAEPHPARPAGVVVRSTPTAAASTAARWRASPRPPARASASCRPRTRAATT